MLAEATAEATRRARERKRVEAAATEYQRTGGIPLHFLQYQADPFGFGTNVLKERFAPGIVRVMRSVHQNQITIARSANATGKTHGAARIATWFYKVYPGAQVYTTAAPPEDNLKLLLWGEIGKVVRAHPELFAGDKVYADMHIARSDFEFITGVTIPSSGGEAEREARFGGKHAPYLLFILDEGDAIPEEVYKAIDSCMSGGFARMLIMFNPRLKSGYVYRKERQRQGNVIVLNALEHPNVVTGDDIFPGAVTREVTVRRFNEMTRALAPDEEVHEATCVEVPDYLVGYVANNQRNEPYPPLPAGWRKIISPEFYYKVMGAYPPAGSTQLISENWIDAAIMRHRAYTALHGDQPPVGLQTRLGLDVGEYGEDPSVLLPRCGGLVYGIKSWQGVDPTVTGDKAIAELNANPKAILYVDAIGVGAGVPGYVFRKVKYPRGRITPVKVSEKPTEHPNNDVVNHDEFGTLRDQLWWSVREWLRTDPSAMLPDDEELKEELLVATYEADKGAVKIMDKATMRKKLNRSPNKADALCLTFAPQKPGFRVEFV